jgi:hypothetical protein
VCDYERTVIFISRKCVGESVHRMYSVHSGRKTPNMQPTEFGDRVIWFVDAVKTVSE